MRALIRYKNPLCYPANDIYNYQTSYLLGLAEIILGSAMNLVVPGNHQHFLSQNPSHRIKEKLLEIDALGFDQKAVLSDN